MVSFDKVMVQFIFLINLMVFEKVIFDEVSASLFWKKRKWSDRCFKQFWGT
jgi:hypothetical protein